jgi:hypothetical protein
LASLMKACSMSSAPVCSSSLGRLSIREDAGGSLAPQVAGTLLAARA